MEEIINFYKMGYMNSCSDTNQNKNEKRNKGSQITLHTLYRHSHFYHFYVCARVRRPHGSLYLRVTQVVDWKTIAYELMK